MPRAPPPLPVIKTRNALPNLILGNLLLLVLVVLQYVEAAPDYPLLGIAFLGMVTIATIGTRSEDRLKRRFMEQRLAELRPVLGTEEAARAQAEKDLGSALDTSPTVPVLAVPAFFLTFASAALTFNAAGAYLAEWHCFLRWPVALVAGFFGWMPMFVIWAGALTPADQDLDLAALRRDASQVMTPQPDDQNDIAIIRQMANLTSLHRRVEAYTLEGTLLSALSFSSFLAVILADSHDYLALIGSMVPRDADWLELPMALRLAGFETATQLPLPRIEYLSRNVMGFICLVLLLCVASFLGVLIGRLHFNEGYRDAESFLRAAERLNEKEERQLERGDAARAEQYRHSIAEMLERAAELQDGMNLMVMHMRVSRNAGVFFFMLSVVLCGLFFHVLVAMVIASIFLAAFLVGFLDRSTRYGLHRKVFVGDALAALLHPLRTRERRRDR